MSDWRDFPAGRGLDRIVAERLGWRIELRVERDGYTVEQRNWYAFDPESSLPDGRLIPYARRDWGEDGAWKAAFSLEDGVSIIPRYSEDANAALALIVPELNLRLFYEPEDGVKEYEAIVWIGVDWNKPGAAFRGFADTPALAICKAWLDWHDKQP